MAGEGLERTPEEIAEIEKSRTLSDAELIKGGAEYKTDEQGETKLLVTDEQIEEIYGNFNREAFAELKRGAEEFLEDPSHKIPDFLQQVNKINLSKLVEEAGSPDEKDALGGSEIKLAEIRQKTEAGYGMYGVINYWPESGANVVTYKKIDVARDSFYARSMTWWLNDKSKEWELEDHEDDFSIPLDEVKDLVK